MAAVLSALKSSRKRLVPCAASLGIVGEFFAEYGRDYGADQFAYIHETALRSGFSTYAHASESRRSMPSVRSRLSSLSELA